jgi:hypothetical protein
MNVEKTRIYIERARSSSLEITLHEPRVASHLKDAFLSVTPHIGRLKSLCIVGNRDLKNITEYVSCWVPFLKELTIDLTCNPTPVLNSTLFNSDLSSLHSLSLTGVITHLPWKGLSNLTMFDLFPVPESKTSITRLLDFFVNAPHLQNITLCGSVPTSSDAPPTRMVFLPSLMALTIIADTTVADPVHSILLKHLHIPAGASQIMGFNFSGDKSRFQIVYRGWSGFSKTCCVTSSNFRFNKANKSARPGGPSGGLKISGLWKDVDKTAPPLDLDHRILRSLGYFSFRMTRRLEITGWKLPALSSPFHILSFMEDLRTITLTQCNNLPFILALNPDKNPSKLVLCPKLEGLILFVKPRKTFNIPDLINMAKERASKGAKLPSITIVGLGELMPGKEAFKLREYVAHVDYRVEKEPPKEFSFSDDESN